MSCKTRLRRWLGAVVLLATCGVGCSGPGDKWPFPEVPGEPSDAVVLATLDARAGGLRALYAVLSLAFDSPERSAVLDAVVRYQSPGRLRMTAFKDLLISARGVFDLVVDRGRFVLMSEVDDRAERVEGTLAELPSVHASLASLARLREGVFLPGLRSGTLAPLLERRGDEILVHTQAATGDALTWILDRRTLGVRQARLKAPEGEIVIRYRSYREQGGRFLPERFELDGPGAGVRIAGVLLELELDPLLGSEDFLPPPGGDADDGVSR